MSVIVLGIAAAHLAVPIVTAGASRSRALTIFVGLINLAAAGALGASQYSPLDLGAAGLGLYLALKGLRSSAPSSAGPSGIMPDRPAAQGQADSGPNLLGVLIGVGLVGFAAFSIMTPRTRDAAPEASSVSAPAFAAMPAPKATRVAFPEQRQTQRYEVSPTERAAPALVPAATTERQKVERCLRISDEEKMIRCLERL